MSTSGWPRSWQFVTSVFQLDTLPPPVRTEVAFVGRSNVGKSSLINALTQHKGLAKTSNTPGRTQCLNYFEPTNGLNLYLVDLPGYGFAKAPKTIVEAWQRTMTAYLRGRPNLHRVFVLVDSRHGLKPIDAVLMGLLDEAGVSYQIVLTKTDKIGAAKVPHVLKATQEGIATHAAAFPEVLVTSSEKGLGIDALRISVLQVEENYRR